MNVKIRVGKLLTKQSKTGKTYYTQPVQVAQFPRQDVTVWQTYSDPQYALEAGVFEAALVLAERERKVGDATYRDIVPRFYDLKPVEA